LSAEEDSNSSTNNEPKQITKTVYVRRRVRNDSSKQGGIIERHWQTGLVVVSLIVSGLVAYKVFWKGRTKPAAPPPREEEEESGMPPQVEGGPAIPTVGGTPPPGLQYPMPNPNVPNGNGSRFGGFSRYAIPKGPAISSWAEKMIQEESMRRVPVYQEPVQPEMILQPQQPQSSFQSTRGNIPVYQYRVPAAPTIQQQQQQPQEGGDIF